MLKSRTLRLTGLIIVMLGLFWLRHWRENRHSESTSWKTPGDQMVPEADIRGLTELESMERDLEQTLWKPELEAQRHEDVMNEFWDRLNSGRDVWQTSAEPPLQGLDVPEISIHEQLPHGIEKFSSPGAPQISRWTREIWQGHLQKWQAEGWNLKGSRWKMIEFRPASHGEGARSLIDFSARFNKSGSQRLAMIRGLLSVQWEAANGEPYPSKIKLIAPQVLTRDGPPGFTERFSQTIRNPDGSPFADPLLAGDLDGDGLSEIILVGANQVFRNHKGTFLGEKLADLPKDRIFAAQLIDWNHDGFPDLCIASGTGIRLFINDRSGRFSSPGTPLWSAPSPLKHPQVLTAGNIMGDGRIALWLGQYKLPYQGGQFPTPYYDAKDGFPGYLLVQNAEGRLEDKTDGSGLDHKRHRRCYSASFVDLNADGRLDLITVSDFAGVDCYLNQGNGTFRDQTENLGDARHLFGMAHAFGDLSGSGILNMLAIGMDSPVASRMQAMNLIRHGFEPHAAKRKAMTSGNRLFHSTKHGLEPNEKPGSIADAGWAWGASIFDANNDGHPDLAIVNGHETAPSVKDYDRQFWMHDIYVAGSTNNPVADLYFRSAQARRIADRASYGGWQANTFFLGHGDGRFDEVAWLLGLGFTQDSQNLVSDDFDGDGRMDLILTTFEKGTGRPQTLRVMHNELSPTGHWVGFRLRAPSHPSCGAVVQIETSTGIASRWVVAGDSYRSQHANSVHFGLGAIQTVIRAEVQWADGTVSRILNPKIDEWHTLVE